MQVNRGMYLKATGLWDAPWSYWVVGCTLELLMIPAMGIVDQGLLKKGWEFVRFRVNIWSDIGLTAAGNFDFVKRKIKNQGEMLLFDLSNSEINHVPNKHASIVHNQQEPYASLKRRNSLCILLKRQTVKGSFLFLNLFF